MVCENYAAGRDILTRSQVRQFLEFYLRTDAELDAFCLDHFPMVKRNFGAGMSRLQKINIFIEQADLIDISRCIRENYKDLNNDESFNDKNKSNIQREAISHASVFNGSARFMRTVRQSLWLVALVGTVGILFWRRIGFRTEPTMTPSIAPANSRPMGQAHPSSRMTVDTQPTDALIFDAESGVMLGRSPWVVRESTLRPQRHICIWHADYLPARLMLSTEDIEKTSLLIRLQPASKSTFLGSGHSGETNKAESCLAKTPLIE